MLHLGFRPSKPIGVRQHSTRRLFDRCVDVRLPLEAAGQGELLNPHSSARHQKRGRCTFRHGCPSASWETAFCVCLPSSSGSVPDKCGKGHNATRREEPPCSGVTGSFVFRRSARNISSVCSVRRAKVETGQRRSLFLIAATQTRNSWTSQCK